MDKADKSLVVQMITKWARNKFSESNKEEPWLLSKKSRQAFDAADHFRLEQEKRSDGYCETCYNEYAALILYAVDEKGKETEIWEDQYISLTDLLAEILQANG